VKPSARLVFTRICGMVRTTQESTMAIEKNTKRETKKAPAKTAKEKKAAKAAKKAAK
jgi:hypothetical protein